MKFITEEYFTKHTPITTIYNEYQNIELLKNVLKMTSWKAWVKRPIGLIKLEGSASTFSWKRRIALIKVENVNLNQ
jgi:hypothetical protein